MKLTKIVLIGLITLLAVSGSLWAVEHDYAESVQRQNANPSPVAGSVTNYAVNGNAVTRNAQGAVTGSVDMNFAASQAQDSQINNYVNQDEQINLSEKSGTVKVLRTDQKVNINKFVTALVEFSEANPRELRHAFRTICRKEGGDADVLQDNVKNEYFLHVVCPEFQLPYLRAAAQALDEPWIKVAEDGDGNLYYKAKFRPVNQCLWISQFYRSGEGFFDLDVANNAIYFNDSPACMGLQKWGLSQIDIPPNQVLLDVTVYEIDAQNDSKIGLDWLDWKNGPGRHLFEGIWTSYHVHDKFNYDGPFTATGNLDSDTGYRYLNAQAVATTEFIDFLQVKGKARELIKTQLMAQSGHFVSANAVDQVVAITAQHGAIRNGRPNAADETVEDNPAVGPGGVSYLPQEHERWLNFSQCGNVSVYVGMTPFVGLESMELSLMIGANAVSGQNADGLPVIDSNMVMNRVRLKDGEPLVVGGITRKTNISRSVKIPVLGSIPVLGWLFGQETNTAREKQVVMIVKPKFIIGAESDLELPAEAQTIMQMAKGEMDIEIPSNGWGFDQWLLDTDK